MIQDTPDFLFSHFRPCVVPLNIISFFTGLSSDDIQKVPFWDEFTLTLNFSSLGGIGWHRVVIHMPLSSGFRGLIPS